MEIFLRLGYSRARSLASLGVPATWNHRWQAAANSGWCFSNPCVMVTNDQMNMPAFHRYWPLFKYSSALSKFGFSTNCSPLKKVGLYDVTPCGGGRGWPTRM